MQISDDQTSERSLAALGAEAVGLLRAGDFANLVARFGYALAYGRDPAVAVQDDLAACLAQALSSGLARHPGEPPTVQYFELNDSGIFAVVECPVPTMEGTSILVELVATREGSRKHITLEQISVAA